MHAATRPAPRSSRRREASTDADDIVPLAAFGTALGLCALALVCSIEQASPLPALAPVDLPGAYVFGA